LISFFFIYLSFYSTSGFVIFKEDMSINLTIKYKEKDLAVAADGEKTVRWIK